jgi:transposase InsO family protein
MTGEAVQEWIRAVGTKTAYIERGSPLENGYIESFNAPSRRTPRRRDDGTEQAAKPQARERQFF